MLICFASRVITFTKNPVIIDADQALYLEIAKLMIQGKILYLQIWEWNPPLIAYLNLIPMATAKLLDLPAPFVLNCMCLSLVSISTISSLSIARCYLPKADLPRMLPMIIGFFIACNSFWFILAEREHLFITFVFPLLLIRYIRCEYKISVHGWLGFALGVYASLGILLKPQFILCYLGFEAALYFATKPYYVYRTSEFKALVMCTAIYLLSLILLPYDAWKTYCSEILPIYINGYEWSKRPILDLLSAGDNEKSATLAFLTSTIIGIFTFKRQSLMPPLIVLMYIAMFNYLYGGQLWHYRAFPLYASALLIQGLAAGMLIELIRKRRPRVWLPITSCILLLSIICAYNDRLFESRQEALSQRFDLRCCGYRGQSLKYGTDEVFDIIINNTTLDDNIVFLGTGINPGYPAILQSNRRQLSRFPFCVVGHIFCAQQRAADSRWDALFEKVVSIHIREIQQNKPKLVFIESDALVPILMKYQFFEKCMGNYSLLQQEPIKEHYLVFIRR